MTNVLNCIRFLKVPPNDIERPVKMVVLTFNLRNDTFIIFIQTLNITLMPCDVVGNVEKFTLTYSISTHII